MSDKTSLLNLLDEYENPRVLEIGVAQGENALAMFQHCPSMSYVGVDEWKLRLDMEHEPNKLRDWNTQEKWDEVYRATLDRLVQYKAEVYRMSSHLFLPTLRCRFDVIVVDGDHSFNGALADLHHSWMLLDMGGSIFVDDMHYGTVSDAVSAFLSRCPAAQLIGSNVIREI